jgi:hypothetical protein
MLATVACTGSEALTLDEYADAATEIAEAYVTESQDASFKYQRDVERLVGEIAASGSATTIEEAVTVMRTETTVFLGLIGDAMVRYIDAFDDLAPPPEVEDAHDAYVAVMVSVQSSLPSMRDSVAASQSLGDIESALAGSAFADGQPAWTASCLALEQTVRDVGRGMDLKCEPSAVAP